MRELREECGVAGTIVRETARFINYRGEPAYTSLVDIGEGVPVLGADPEFSDSGQILCDVRWMRLSEMPERDRSFVWAGGLHGVEGFMDEALSWGDEISYPRSDG